MSLGDTNALQWRKPENWCHSLCCERGVKECPVKRNLEIKEEGIAEMINIFK